MSQPQSNINHRICYWQTSRYKIDLSAPKVMGIVNVTPDSFSDGGKFNTTERAIKHAEQLVKDGADILDIGAESTRPGTPAVPIEVELERLLPVLKEITQWGVPISVDTYKPLVMQQVLDFGVDIINDVWGLRMAGTVDAIATNPSCGVCIMHMHGEPQTMQTHPMEGQITETVFSFLQKQAQVLVDAGVSTDRITVDYGIGFGKTVAQNFELLAQQARLLQLGYPLLAAWSRKSSLGEITGRSVTDRLAASLAVAVLALERGAKIIRVHDVKETVDVLKVQQASKVQGKA